MNKTTEALELAEVTHINPIKHTTADNYEHFLSYMHGAGARHSAFLCQAYFDGSNAPHEEYEAYMTVHPEPVKQEPVAFKFPREPKPENAMGWTIDYGLIRQIAEDIGDQEFHPGYEGIELTLMALEHIYTAQVPDRLAAAAHDLLKELQECRDLLKCVETCSRNNFENLADERVQAINAAIAAFKEKNK